MRVVPHMVQPGQKFRRWPTATRAGRVFQPGDVLYLIQFGGEDRYFRRAFSRKEEAVRMVTMLGGPIFTEKDFVDLPTTVI